MKTKQKTLDFTFFYKEDVDKFAEALDTAGKYDYVIISYDAQMLHPYFEYLDPKDSKGRQKLWTFPYSDGRNRYLRVLVKRS